MNKQLRSLASLGSIFRRAPPGAMPGTIDLHDDHLVPEMRVIGYGGPKLIDKQLTRLAELDDIMEAADEVRPPVVWIDVNGLGDEELLHEFGERFGLHPLALEDVAHVHQRAKVERFDEHDFVVLRSARIGASSLDIEQMSFFLGDGWVISFQERPGDVFEPVRQRILRDRGRIRRCGADYLLYALLDAVVDGYFPVLETYDGRLEGMEASIMESPKRAIMAELHGVKGDLMVLRRAIWPLREMLSGLVRDEAPRISDEVQVYLRDCQDHAIQLLDLVESWREMAGSLMDLYLSQVSNRMNEVMKVLTIISSFFIPLSFFAGLYGMNFDGERSPLNMPELRWAYGYPALLTLMVGITIGMYVFFRRKGWLGGDDS